MTQQEEMLQLLTTLTKELHTLHEELHHVTSLNERLQAEQHTVNRELNMIKLAIVNDNIIG